MGKAAVIPVTSRSDSSAKIGSGSPAQSRIFSGWNRLLVRERRLRTRNHRFPVKDKSQGWRERAATMDGYGSKAAELAPWGKWVGERCWAAQVWAL